MKLSLLGSIYNAWKRSFDTTRLIKDGYSSNQTKPETELDPCLASKWPGPLQSLGQKQNDTFLKLGTRSTMSDMVSHSMKRIWNSSQQVNCRKWIWLNYHNNKKKKLDSKAKRKPLFIAIDFASSTNCSPSQLNDIAAITRPMHVVPDDHHNGKRRSGRINGHVCIDLELVRRRGSPGWRCAIDRGASVFQSERNMEIICN